MDADDPRHGTPRGYAAGCRTDDDCPSTPASCRAVRQADQIAYRRRKEVDRAHGRTEGAQITHVLRRLDETIAHAGMPATLARIGMTAADLDQVRAYGGALLDYETAEQLDQAWSYLVHGSDTRAPDFEHGRGVTSYVTWHCRCRPCTIGHVRAKTASKLRVARPTARVRDTEQLDVIRRHAERLYEGAAAWQVARATGLAISALNSCLAGRPVTHATAQAVLATTPRMVANQALRLPSKPVNHQVRTMEALGYPLRWTAAQSGVSETALTHLPKISWCTRDVAERIAVVARRVGDTPAGPDQGVPYTVAQQTRGRARANGWWPPDCYDEHLNLSPHAVRGEDWSKMDEGAAIRVNALWQLTRGATHAQAARTMGVSKRLIARLPHGLTYVRTDGRIGPDVPAGTDLELSRTRSWNRIKQISDVKAALDINAIGPVTAALRLGLPVGPIHAGAPHQDHPELVAWRNHQAAITEVA